MFLAEASIQLVPDGTLLLHVLFIAVMVFVLNRTLLKPINQILAEREKQIGGRLSEAESLTAEADEKMRNYQSALREAERAARLCSADLRGGARRVRMRCRSRMGSIRRAVGDAQD